MGGLLWKNDNLEHRTYKLKPSKNMCFLLLRGGSLEQHINKLGASRNRGAMFPLWKKTALSSIRTR